jgi:hypothetical protein
VYTRSSLSSGISLSNSGLPNITGDVYSTPDGKQICMITYKVTEELCNTIVSNEYTRYQPDVVSVMQGCGYTIAGKLTSLPPQDFVIDIGLFMVYSAHRLTISQVLFGSFDVKFLKQKYYPKFIKN